MAGRKLEGEDLKVANAITNACQGVGYALLVTFREAMNPTHKGIPLRSEKIVADAWQKAADAIIDALMEED